MALHQLQQPVLARVEDPVAEQLAQHRGVVTAVCGHRLESGALGVEQRVVEVRQAAGLLATSRTAIKLLGRFGTKPTAVAGLLLLTAAAGWLTTISASTTYLGGIFGPMLLVGLALGLIIVPINVAIMSTVDPQDAGAASGLLQTMMMMMMTGAALGIGILSTIYAATADSKSAARISEGAVALGMRHGFVAGTIFALLALVVTLVVLKTPVPAEGGTPV